MVKKKEDLDLLEKQETKIEKEKLGRVIVLNDNYTPQKFVVECIVQFCERTYEEACTIMIKAHVTGQADCGVFELQVALTIADLMMEFAKENQHPLRVEVKET